MSLHLTLARSSTWSSTSTSTRSRHRRTPERALPHAGGWRALMPGAGHVVHMPAHIYYRVGHVPRVARHQQARDRGRRATTSRPRPPIRCTGAAYYPHNIHFVMVSAQMGGDGKTAIEAAAKLDASIPAELAKQFAIMEPVKAAPYTTHAQFSDADSDPGAARRPTRTRARRTMYHYARAVALRAQKDAAGRAGEIDALGAIERRPTSSRTTRGACRRRRSCRPRGWSPRAPGRRRGRPRRRREGVRGRDRDRGQPRATWSRRTGTTRCASRSAVGAAAAGPARRGREGVPRFARARAQQRLGARRARRGVRRRGDAKGEQGGARGVSSARGSVPRRGPDPARL